MKRALVAWSGGKDSSLALRALLADDAWEPVGLLTTLTREHARISMHGVREDLLRRQADALGLPLWPTWIPQGCDDATYRAVMLEAMRNARKAEIEAIAFGDLFLQDVRDYRVRMMEGTGIEPIFPIWQEPTDTLARRFIEDGFRAVLACVDTQQVTSDFAGRDFDASLLRDLPSSADPCGENGEFHTFVHDGPIFAHPVVVTRGERVLREDRFMYCDLIGPDS